VIAITPYKTSPPIGGDTRIVENQATTVKSRNNLPTDWWGYTVFLGACERGSMKKD